MNASRLIDVDQINWLIQNGGYLYAVACAQKKLFLKFDESNKKIKYAL